MTACCLLLAETHSIMRIAAAALLVTLALATAVSVFAAPLPAGHPLIGTWKITLPDGSCSEIYIVRRNGTSLVTSAEEVAESEFTVSDEPSERGFYKWVDTVAWDNGRKDCAGEVTEVGHVATNYVLFSPMKTQFLMCEQEDLASCIGPFVRLGGTDT